MIDYAMHSSQPKPENTLRKRFLMPRITVWPSLPLVLIGGCGWIVHAGLSAVVEPVDSGMDAIAVLMSKTLAKAVNWIQEHAMGGQFEIVHLNFGPDGWYSGVGDLPRISHHMAGTGNCSWCGADGTCDARPLSLPTSPRLLHNTASLTRLTRYHS